MLYLVNYTGPMGYIKPWTAVRDSKTFSEKFLPPATIEGISQKLFGLGERSRIQRYRLCFDAFSVQQEQTRAQLAQWNTKTETLSWGQSVLDRGLLLNPELKLAFLSQADAETAFEQHVCLCRNEDILFPDAEYGIRPVSENEFDLLDGFEMIASTAESGIPAGRNRYSEGHPMTYGELIIQGSPVRRAF